MAGEANLANRVRPRVPTPVVTPVVPPKAPTTPTTGSGISTPYKTSGVAPTKPVKPATTVVTPAKPATPTTTVTPVTPAKPPAAKPPPATPLSPQLEALPVAPTVEQRLAEITGKDSQLNQLARADAQAVMNRRGFLNSSMTEEAAQDAVLRNALPIAQDDAAHAAAERSQVRTINEANLEQTRSLNEAEEQQIRDINYRTGEAERDRVAQERLANINADLQKQLTTWNLKSGDRGAAAQFLTNMETMYQSSYQSILSNTALSADQRTQLLTAAKQLRDHDLNFVEQMYNIDLKW